MSVGSVGVAQFLLAKGTRLFLAQPFLDAVDVEEMGAGQPINLFLWVDVAVADRAQLALHCLAPQPLQLLEMLC